MILVPSLLFVLVFFSCFPLIVLVFIYMRHIEKKYSNNLEKIRKADTNGLILFMVLLIVMVFTGSLGYRGFLILEPVLGKALPYLVTICSVALLLPFLRPLLVKLWIRFRRSFRY